MQRFSPLHSLFSPFRLFLSLLHCPQYTKKPDGSDAKNAPAVVRLCTDRLREMVRDPDANLKYLGLTGLTSLMRSNPKVRAPCRRFGAVYAPRRRAATASLASLAVALACVTRPSSCRRLSYPHSHIPPSCARLISLLQVVAEHRELVLECLVDEDVTIRLRALDLITGMVTRRNLPEIVKRLLELLEAAEVSSVQCRPSVRAAAVGAPTAPAPAPEESHSNSSPRSASPPNPIALLPAGPLPRRAHRQDHLHGLPRQVRLLRRLCVSGAGCV